MYIPYVIDNQYHRLADVLNAILTEHKGKSLDIATAYFNVQGYKLLREGLEHLGSFRLLFGDEPLTSSDLGIRPATAIQLLFELNSSPYNEETLQLVESLIAYLRRELVEVRAYRKGFLHAKCYMFYNDLPVGIADRFQPRIAIVGSSNFTGPGLTSNKELNLSHKAILTDEELQIPETTITMEELASRQKLMGSVGAQAISDLDKWFRHQWEASEDFKQPLIDLLDSSKFGQKEYTPYQVYMKALFGVF